MSAPTILFGLDGATYTLLDDLFARGVMPYMKKFMETGVRATMMSTTPPLTPPAWSTLVTGRTPGHHGITGFFQYDSPEGESVQMVSSRQMKAETLWSMVNRQGVRAGCLNFVAHQPAPKIDGWAIPGWISWRWVKQFSHPAGVTEKLKADLPGFDVKRLAMDFEEERKAVTGSQIDDYRGWIDLHIDRERQWFEVLKYLQNSDPAGLIGIVFDGVDKLQHRLWHFIDPRIAPSEPSVEFDRVREATFDYYRSIDRLLEEIDRMYDGQATILIPSDHGFTASTEIVFVNVWLEQNGYLTWQDDIENTTDVAELEPAFYRFGAFKPESTTAYALTTASNGVYVNVKGRRGEFGIDPANYRQFRDELAHRLLTEFKDPATGEPIITAVTTCEEAFDGPQMGLAPDLTLTLRDHGFVSVRRHTQTIEPRSEVLGTHHPEGILILKGPHLKQGVQIDPVHLLDVAPTVLCSMGLTIPAALQGRVIEEAFQPEFLAAHPARWAELAPAAPAAEPAAEEQPESEDADILEKMKALGYLE